MLDLKPALQYSEGRSSPWSGSRLVNCFAETADGDKRSAFAVMATPGLTLWASAGDGPERGGIVVNGILYVVSGSTLYSVSIAGVVTALGTIAGSDPVRMAGNNTEVAIVGGTIGYVYSGSTLSTPLSYAVSDVTYADGYMLWVMDDSEQFFISALDDALTYDATDIASVEGFPDNIVGVVNDHRDIQFFGNDSTEIFYNSGAVDFPFVRQGNAFIERGCFDRDSIIKTDNSVNFVGDDRVAYVLDGYKPRRISTHAVEKDLAAATYARGFAYDQEGHKFYGLELDGVSWLLDHSTGAWHQRQSDGMDYWRVSGAVKAYNKTLLLDRVSGNIYTPDLDVFDENGNTIAVDIYLPTLEYQRERMSMYAFEVVCETGVGNAAVTDPQIMLRYSDDGGHRWSNEMWRSLGKIGEYSTLVKWHKLGRFRNRQMHLRITDSTRRLIISYHADIA